MWWNVRTAFKDAPKMVKLYIKTRKRIYEIPALGLPIGKEELNKVKAVSLMSMRETRITYLNSFEGVL